MSVPLRSPRWWMPVALAGLSLGCMGRVEPGEGGGGPPSSGSGSSSSSSGGSGSSSGPATSSGGSSSSSGGLTSSSSSSGGPTSSSSSSGAPSPGDPNCSELAVPNLARVCPDGTSVGGQYILSNHECVLEFPCPAPSGGCSQGASCSPGSGCGGGSSGANGNPGCETSCMCDGTGHLQCSTTCSAPVCSQGAACSLGESCGTSVGLGGGCSTYCTCGPDGTLDCNVCDDAGPPPPVTNPCPGLAIPDICEVCANGTTECAHHIVVMGQCEIEICPGS